MWPDQPLAEGAERGLRLLCDKLASAQLQNFREEITVPITNLLSEPTLEIKNSNV